MYRLYFDLGPNNDYKVAGFFYAYVFTLKLKPEVMQWCVENNVDCYVENITRTMFDLMPPHIMIEFINEEDCVLFKLRWS